MGCYFQVQLAPLAHITWALLWFLFQLESVSLSKNLPLGSVEFEDILLIKAHHLDFLQASIGQSNLCLFGGFHFSQDSFFHSDSSWLALEESLKSNGIPGMVLGM